MQMRPVLALLLSFVSLSALDLGLTPQGIKQQDLVITFPAEVVSSVDPKDGDMTIENGCWIFSGPFTATVLGKYVLEVNRDSIVYRGVVLKRLDGVVFALKLNASADLEITPSMKPKP